MALSCDLSPLICRDKSFWERVLGSGERRLAILHALTIASINNSGESH